MAVLLPSVDASKPTLQQIEVGNLLVGAPSHIVVDPIAVGLIADLGLQILSIVVIDQPVVVVIRIDGPSQRKLLRVAEAGNPLGSLFRAG